jgi:hypothetical protein
VHKNLEFDPISDWPQDEHTEAGLARDYGHLVRYGITQSPRGFDSSSYWSFEPPEQWRVQVAEPWWAEIRARAARDQLPVECFVGGDMMLWMHDRASFSAAARLVRADGSAFFDGWVPGEEALKAMRVELGERLVEAQTRWPYDYGVLGQPRPRQP